MVRPPRLIDGYLAAGERVIFDEPPDLRAWFFLQWPEHLGIIATLVVMLNASSTRVLVAGAVVLVLLVASLAWQVVERAYTRYVLTDHRVLRMSGTLRRDHEWMSWKKITDVSVQRGVVDRMFGTATIRIQSANEASGFAAMRDVPHPDHFAEIVVRMVNQAQGRLDVDALGT